MSTIKKSNIQKICICGMFSALYFGLEYASQMMSTAFFADSVQLPLSSLPLVIAAVMFGPFWAAGVGMVGGFLAQLFSSYGLMITTPIWIAPAVIQGLVLGALFFLFKKRTDFTTLFTIILFGAIVLTVLNSVALYCDGLINHWNSPIFSISLAVRVCLGIAASIVFSLITPPIIKVIRKVIP